MGYFAGVLLALAILLFARVVGFERDRSFYPIVLVVIASYYGLFAVMSGSIHTLIAELVVIVSFLLISAVGFKLDLWFIVAGLIAHGMFDFVHAGLIQNTGVPRWWPMFCLTFDITAGACLAWRLYLRSGDAVDTGKK